MMNSDISGANPLRRRLIMACGTLPFVPLLAGAREADLPILEAVDQAGRQRSIPQRIARFYAQQVCSVRADEAVELKQKSITVFEQQNRALTEFATHHNARNILDTYTQMNTLWGNYKNIANGTPSLAGLKQLAILDEQLLGLAQQSTDQFSTLSGTPLGKLVALAGRDRMLSQRISKFYFFEACGLQTPQIAGNLEAGRKEFVSNMANLKASPTNTKAIKSSLTLADTQWLFFDSALHGAKDTQDLANLRNNVAVASENIFDVLDQLVDQYASLS